MMSRGWVWLVWTSLVIAGARAVPAQETPPVAAKEPAPSVFYTGAGRFEIIVTEVGDAQAAQALGRSVWGALTSPLGLPANGFSSPVSVRLVPAGLWNEPAVFTVTAEPGGRVNVRIKWLADIDPLVVRRAFVQGLILRQAVAWHAVGPKLTVPLWLEQACTAWSLVHDRPAMMDSFQYESSLLQGPPSLPSLLQWRRGAVESRGWELASLWLFMQLQSEPGPASQWGGWLRGVVGGAPAYATLPRAYEGRWPDGQSLELWWQVAFHHQRRARGLPVMSVDVSRAWMQDRSRWPAGRGGRETVLLLDELYGLRKEPWIKAQLKERQAQIRTVLTMIHPYYANAALSMGQVYDAASRGDEPAFLKALKQFEKDAMDARDLEETVGAILDTAPRK